MSEFVMKKTSSLKFNDMILFIITILGDGDVVVAAEAAVAVAYHLFDIVFYLLCYALLRIASP